MRISEDFGCAVLLGSLAGLAHERAMRRADRGYSKCAACHSVAPGRT